MFYEIGDYHNGSIDYSQANDVFMVIAALVDKIKSYYKKKRNQGVNGRE